MICKGYYYFPPAYGKFKYVNVLFSVLKMLIISTQGLMVIGDSL